MNKRRGLFKGIDIRSHEWIRGYLCKTNALGYGTISDCICTCKDAENGNLNFRPVLFPACRCSDIADKNYDFIYEFDVVRFGNEEYSVLWDNGKFFIKFGSAEVLLNDIASDCEIIDNLWDRFQWKHDKELLKCQ